MFSRRHNLLTALYAAMKIGDMFKVSEVNKQLNNITRGKGRGGATRNFHRPYNTYFPASRRNGSKECARRLRQI